MEQHYRNYLAACALTMMLTPLLSLAQDEAPARNSMLRISEDNDFINIVGNSTDKAYTNGTTIDYFYSRQNKPRSFFNRFYPKAGSNSNNIYSWGISEIMFTPNNLHDTMYQPADYPYSTAIFITHGLYSYNASTKINFHTEIVAGVRGPAALGRQTQTFIHRLLNFQTPLGWDNQLRNKVILNFNFAAEKQLLDLRGKMDIIAGAKLEAGNFTNAITFYLVIRVGKMLPYFNGLIQQFTGGWNKSKPKSVQLYLLFKPGVTFYAGNGMLQANNQSFRTEGKNEKLPGIEHTVWFFNGGAVLSFKRMGISFNQNFTSALLQQLYAHAIGNVSVYYCEVSAGSLNTISIPNKIS